MKRAAFVTFLFLVLVCSVSADEEQPDGIPIGNARSLTGDIPRTHARAYSLKTEQLNESAAELVRELGLGFQTKNPLYGIYVTMPRRLSDDHFPGLDHPDGWKIRRVTLHIFVPQDVEPARIYVNSEVNARNTNEKKSFTLYNVGVVENWFLDKLDERLDSTGHTMPLAADERYALFEQLSPDSNGECTSYLVDRLAAARIPERIFAPELRISRESPAQVMLSTFVLEDGFTLWPDLISDTTENGRYGIHARHTVSFWRYKPAVEDNCRRIYPMTVLVHSRQM